MDKARNLFTNKKVSENWFLYFKLRNSRNLPLNVIKLKSSHLWIQLFRNHDSLKKFFLTVVVLISSWNQRNSRNSFTLEEKTNFLYCCCCTGTKVQKEDRISLARSCTPNHLVHRLSKQSLHVKSAEFHMWCDFLNTMSSNFNDDLGKFHNR